MEKKYCDMLSKIKADDGFKKELTALLEEKQRVRTHRTVRRYFMNSHRRKWITAAAALVLLACTGVVMAALHISFGSKKDGVQFSDSYPLYVETVSGQTAGGEKTDTRPSGTPVPPKSGEEKLDMQTSGDGIQVALESYLCDEGFLDLQFRVKISEEKLDAFRSDSSSDWEEPLTYLSFNDPVVDSGGIPSVRLGGANYTLTIDGQDVWLRGRTAQSIEKISVGEYVIQQMWFLDESTLGGRDSFRISLGDVAVGLGENCIPLNGSFDLSVSRAKAAAASSVIELKDNSWSPRAGVTKTVEKVSQTPLQSIFHIRSVYTGVSSGQLDADLWDYLVYDADGQPQAAYSARISAEIIYADGVTEQLADPVEYDFERSSFENASFVTEEIVATAPVKGCVTLRAYEDGYSPDYRMTAAAEYQVDLSAGTVEARTVNTVIYDAGTGEMDSEFGVYFKLRYGLDVSHVLGTQGTPDESIIADRGEYVSELD